MEQFFDPVFLKQRLTEATVWAQDNIFVLGASVQLAVIAVAFLVAHLSAPSLQRYLEKRTQFVLYERYLRPVANALAPMSLALVWLVLQWFSGVAAAQAGWPTHVIRIGVSLLTAWVVIRFASSLIRNASLSRAIATVAWTIAALNITALLDPTMAVLDSMALVVGNVRISVLGVAKALIALGILLWLAGLISRLVERQLAAMPGVTPAAAVLLGKLFRIVVFAVAVVVSLDAVGIDLTAFAVFSGAIGLGIGFGLQRVFSNLISGLILLMDRSVKPGDVIAVAGTYGSINSLGARCVSVITRDGIEHLIPNEELISQRVENWSYTNRLVRLKMPFGVSYDCDLRRAIELSIEAATAEGRVRSEPKPVCQLKGFGDNAVDMELRVWISDPQNGVGNVTSAILLGVWDRFHEHGITFPFPQRDIHIKSLPAELINEATVVVTETEPDMASAEEGGVVIGESKP